MRSPRFLIMINTRRNPRLPEVNHSETKQTLEAIPLLLAGPGLPALIVVEQYHCARARCSSPNARWANLAGLPAGWRTQSAHPPERSVACGLGIVEDDILGATNNSCPAVVLPDPVNNFGTHLPSAKHTLDAGTRLAGYVLCQLVPAALFGGRPHSSNQPVSTVARESPGVRACLRRRPASAAFLSPA